MRRTPWLPSGPFFRTEGGGLDPRFWLLLAVLALLGSFVPYAAWMGKKGFLVNAVLTLVAAGSLIMNVRGERKLARSEER